MWIQLKFSKAESNTVRYRSLVARLNFFKIGDRKFITNLCKVTLALIVPIALGYATTQRTLAATLWYTGDPDGQAATPNQRFWVGARTANRVVLEDFTIPTSDVGWQIHSVWSNNVIFPPSTFTQVSWSILTVRQGGVGEPPFTYDRFIASGEGDAEITSTPFQVFDQPVLKVSVLGLDVRLNPGTYRLIVAPFFDYEDRYSFPASAIATTNGSNAIGTLPENRDNSLTGGYEPIFFADNRNYSMGIEGEVVPEPASILGVLTFSAFGLGFRQWRKRKFTCGSNNSMIR